VAGPISPKPSHKFRALRKRLNFSSNRETVFITYVDATKRRTGENLVNGWWRCIAAGMNLSNGLGRFSFSKGVWPIIAKDR
jgi:hypothetical protein